MGQKGALRQALTRRDIIMGAAAAVAVSGRQAGASVTADQSEPWDQPALARGRVLEDCNSRGPRCIQGRGLPGVMVSNGRDVVLTTEDGHWQLPVAGGDTIFVIKPSSWMSPTGPYGQPAFSYLHQPDGTPRTLDLRHPAVEPTGPLPASIDFYLRRSEECSQFDVLLVADTQPCDARELAFVRDAIISLAPATNAAFAIHHGDVMGDDLSLFPRYLRMLRTTGMAWHHCPGNHDMNLETPDGRHAFETWKRFIGPTHYALQYGRATFLLLNNVNYFGWDNIPNGRRGYRGEFGAQQLAFVENVLRHVPEDHLVVVSMHIPLVSFDEPESEADTTVDRGALLELLARFPNTVSFAGHSHTTEHHYLGAGDGFGRSAPHHHHVLTAACGSWWSGPADHRGIPVSVSCDGSPKGVHILSIDGNRCATRLVSADPGPATEAGMRILVACDGNGQADATSRPLGCQISQHQLPGARLFVDVFDGGPRTEVHVDIDRCGAGRFALNKVAAPDPFVVDYFAGNARDCKPWVEAVSCSHLWSAALPAGLAPGAYRVTATARNEYGHVSSAHMVLEVTD